MVCGSGRSALPLSPAEGPRKSEVGYKRTFVAESSGSDSFGCSFRVSGVEMLK